MPGAVRPSDRFVSSTELLESIVEAFAASGVCGLDLSRLEVDCPALSRSNGGTSSGAVMYLAAYRSGG